MANNSLRQLRLEQRKTYRELSEKLAIPISTLRSLEEGSLDQTIERLKRLTAELGTSIDGAWTKKKRGAK